MLSGRLHKKLLTGLSDRDGRDLLFTKLYSLLHYLEMF